MNQPYNVVHEMYRVLYVKDQLRKEREQQEKEKEERERRKAEKEEREKRLHQVPAIFAANTKNTPPLKIPQESDAQNLNISAEDIEDFIEEVAT